MLTCGDRSNVVATGDTRMLIPIEPDDETRKNEIKRVSKTSSSQKLQSAVKRPLAMYQIRRGGCSIIDFQTK